MWDSLYYMQYKKFEGLDEVWLVDLDIYETRFIYQSCMERKASTPSNPFTHGCPTCAHLVGPNINGPESIS